MAHPRALVLPLALVVLAAPLLAAAPTAQAPGPLLCAEWWVDDIRWPMPCAITCNSRNPGDCEGCRPEPGCRIDHLDPLESTVPVASVPAGWLP